MPWPVRVADLVDSLNRKKEKGKGPAILMDVEMLLPAEIRHEGLDVKTDRSVSIEIFSPFVRDQYFYVMLIICYANDVDLFN